ncbi:MAG: hypothetical protein HY040_05880 [Planctomycetes bacterium]|nr:hypothetical protein [Planctomycetota bacterium]
MSEGSQSALESIPSLQAILGYLNFSEGKPDARFQKQLNDAFAVAASAGSPTPWCDLAGALRDGLQALKQSGSAAFRDASQARHVMTLVFQSLLPAYRAHHADLLGHVSEVGLWQPFFLARTFEAVLGQRGPWEETERIVAGALRQLNDFVGNRPVAVLENRERGEVYDHERVRPIPLYMRGAGVAWGSYQPLLLKALEILQDTDAHLLADACFDPAVLDELALDPRGYDFGHPVDKRPNYVFGEWDPHHIDNQGRFRRFVVRPMLLAGLWERVNTQVAFDQEELLFEAAAVLAGTILMAAGVSGAGPQTYDSTVNLSNLVPRIARYREAFYAGLLDKVAGVHGERLRHEAQTSRQAFAGARQHLNQYLGRQRAWQVQQRHLALLLAEIGFPSAIRRQLVSHIPQHPQRPNGVAQELMELPASIRILTEIHIHLTTGHMRIDRGELAEAAKLLPQIESLLQGGIACGALVDPWNILGFQGQFPRFVALEDSIRDNRIDDLLRAVERLFHFYSRVMSEGAATGSFAPDAALATNMRHLAVWWDRFATTTVGDMPHIHGEEAAASAEHVAGALTRWRERGAAGVDLAFWREHLEGFHTSKSFALVVEALLRKEDFRAAMALLMTWLGQTEQAPLEDGPHSFHQLALRWMLGVCALASRDHGEFTPGAGPVALVRRFFDYLEANAEEYWQVPRLDLLGADADEVADEETEDEEDSLYGAAYEGMTYQDSTDDDVEAEVLDVMPQKDFDLTEEAERLDKRLKFLATLARLWNIATRALRDLAGEERQLTQEAAKGWLERARTNLKGILSLLDAIHEHEIPKPSAAYENVVEYDRRRLTKERLLGLAIGTCLDQALAIGALRGAMENGSLDTPPPPPQPLSPDRDEPPWEPLILRMERALLKRDPALARSWLPEFIRLFRDEPLLYTPLSQGGHPRDILRAGIAQTILRGLCANLPKQGLLLETHQLVRLAHAMEQGQSLEGPRYTEFNRLFQLGVQAVTEAVVDAAQGEAIRPERIISALEAVVEPFLAVWMEHARTLRVSRLESISTERDWKRLADFIRRYGRDVFTPHFLAVGNMRGLLGRGIGAYLDYLIGNPDPLKPVLLVDELGTRIGRPEAERWLEIILQTLLENHDNLYDFNQTIAQASYGENLYQLFDFLRLKASYERNAWQLRPLNMVHEVLARKHPQAGSLWREQVEMLCRENAKDHLRELGRLESAHGIRLPTVRDSLEERFVRPLAIDGLCAMIEPAMEEAPKLLDQDAHPKLEEALSAFARTPSGVGIEAPQWLQRLEGELYRVRTTKSALVAMAETLFQVPKVPTPFEELAGQLRELKKEE